MPQALIEGWRVGSHYVTNYKLNQLTSWCHTSIRRAFTISLQILFTVYSMMVTCSNFEWFNVLISVDLQWSSTEWQYVIPSSYLVTMVTAPSLGYCWDTDHLGNLSDDIIMYWITWPLLFSPTNYSSWLLACHHHLPSMNCDGFYSCTGYQLDQLYCVL